MLAAALLAGGLGLGCRADVESPPNLLLITLDTTRRDAVAPIAAREATPRLAELADQAIVFRDAYSAANVTNPSHISILTGLPALEHGVFDNYQPLSRDIDSVPQALQRSGYTTAFVPAIPHLWQAPSWRGFDLLVATFERRTAATVTDRAIRWLDEKPSGRPFFLWAHYFDAHTPYLPDPEVVEPVSVPAHLPGEALLRDRPFFQTAATRAMVGWLEDWSNPAYPAALYTAAVRSVDFHVGRLLDGLTARGLADTTIVVVTADHGESLGEHGIDWAHSGIYQPQVRVPLLIRVPGLAAGIRDDRVSHLDLAPTVSDLLGLELRHHLPGISLVPFLGAPPTGSPLFDRLLRVESARNMQVAAFRGDLKLIVPIAPRPPLPQEAELFDLEEDPHEQINLLPGALDRARELSGATTPWRERGLVRSDTVVDEATRREMEALGYAR